MKLKTIVLFTSLALLAARADTITVTSIADSGPGSLRNALASAADGDTIDATGVSGTILLTSGELLVNKNLTIVGPGSDNLAVDGNAASRVFHIGSNTVVSIFGLTITNGGGSGIYNGKGTLSVKNCLLRGNTASNGGGIFNDHGTVTVSNSVISDNWGAGFGGGIVNDVEFGGDATLTILNSVISGNVCGYGGGGIFNAVTGHGNARMEIANSAVISNSAGTWGGGGIYNWVGESSIATVTIVSSTLSGNSATRVGGGGGIFNRGSDGGSATMTINKSILSGNSADSGGGGILNLGFAGGGSATLLIANSTLSGNLAVTSGGGIFNIGEYSGSARLRIINSTLSGNSAAQGDSIFNSMLALGLPAIASVEIGSTILNTSGSGCNITNASGTVTSLSYNLSNDDGNGYLTGIGDRINTDPMLGPLQDNGGPTFTHALLPGSPAIDQGKDLLGSPSDQRGDGFERTSDDLSVTNAADGDATDIGAFEIQQVSPPRDSDGDGVTDDVDECPDTPPGAIVSSTGCSIAQLVPCDGPLSGGSWKNHGQYVRAVGPSATHFLRAGLIARRQWAQIVTQAAHSKCGWNRHWDRDGDRDWHRNWDWNHDGDRGGDKDHGWH